MKTLFRTQKDKIKGIRQRFNSNVELGACVTKEGGSEETREKESVPSQRSFLRKPSTHKSSQAYASSRLTPQSHQK